MTEFTNKAVKSRGAAWLAALAPQGRTISGTVPSVRVVDADFCGEPARFIAVVPDPQNHYPRARTGEVGLLEGWTLGRVLLETIEEDADKSVKRPIIAVIDVTSQAYGRREEAFGIHQALASAAAGYANARLHGHPVVGFIVAKAMSGAFLAHGYQANALIALNDPQVLIHAMGKAAAARITLRTVDELDRFAQTVPPMAYDIRHYATLGLLDKLLDVENPDEPTSHDLDAARDAIAEGIRKGRRQFAENGAQTLDRFGAPNRAASQRVRELMRTQWRPDLRR